MSNHVGGYMLNEVLSALKETGITSKLTQDEKRYIARKVLEIGRGYDCNDGEILDQIAKEFGVCSICDKDTTEFKEDYCLECYERYYANENEDD